MSRLLIVPPRFAEIDHELAAEISDTSVALRDVPSVSSRFVLTAPDAAFHSLRHRLSGAYIGLHGHRPAADRSSIEGDALLRCGGLQVGSRLDDDAAFTDWLAALNRCCGATGEWRTGPIGTTPDARGRRILFPPPAGVPDQLIRLRILISNESPQAPALFHAALALALLTNCHPFCDGNGRVGRILFNAVLQARGMSAGVYIPVSELCARSFGGFEIALREGELHGPWAPYLRFFAALMRTHRRLATLEGLAK